ncbi:Na/Pi cotransporter family protein [Bacillus tuaregi]|uniref:Na/Pi cotransporter family protein n=1 Tax=Bacillus tuaregi TaxID=1816695 RepID=UPI000ABBAC41|nr:Na/Pi cotransporter family protein [Bacillus tuaregi]
MEIVIQRMLFELLGGVGIFLYSITTMRTGLQSIAGNKLKDILDRFTSNPLIGFLAGILVTGMIQSSTATTVITVGLVGAGFMNLRQAIGVILGANIGTTVTALIIGFNIEEYSLPIIAIGAFLLFFFKKKTMQNIGQIIFGLGGIFYGLELISIGVEPMSELEMFKGLSLQLSSIPLLGVLVGTISTMLVHSSSAAIGILQGLYADSLISLEAALPILYGDNIGTTISAVIVSIGTSTVAKRAASIHVFINVMGTIIFLILLQPFAALILWISGSIHLSPEMAIAFAHALYNIFSSLLFLPFISVLILFAKKLIPGEDSVIEYRAKRLDPHLIKQSTSIALGQAKEEVIFMGEFAIKGLKESLLFFKTKHEPHAMHTKQMEDFLNSLDRKITNYLIDIGLYSLTERESEEQNKLISIVRELEGIGDLFDDIIDHSEYGISLKVNFSKHGVGGLEELFELTIATVKEAMNALDQNNKDAAKLAIEKKDLLNKMEEELRKEHVLRIQSGECSPQAEIVFIDIINNLVRIGDHAVNIAHVLLKEENFYEVVR